MRLRLLDHASITTAHGLRIVGFLCEGGGPPPTFDAGVITPPLGVNRDGPRGSIQESGAAAHGTIKRRLLIYRAKIKNKFFGKIAVTGVTV